MNCPVCAGSGLRYYVEMEELAHEIPCEVCDYRTHRIDVTRDDETHYQMDRLGFAPIDCDDWASEVVRQAIANRDEDEARRLTHDLVAAWLQVHPTMRFTSDEQRMAA